jgi:hypothetical protein
MNTNFARFSTLVLMLLLLVLMGISPISAQEPERTGEAKDSKDNNQVSVQSVSVDPSPPSADLAAKLMGTEVILSNISFTGDDQGSGFFSGGSGIVGIESGVIFGSGRVIDVVGPNTSDSTSTIFGFSGDDDLNSLIPGYYNTYDATALEFDFECPTGTAGEDVISFRYVFASEEYNEYANSPYNDVFGLFLNETNVALLPDGVTPISINNVNRTTNPEYYINNDLSDGGGSIDIEADGLTVVLDIEANLNPGVNNIKLAIADAGDHSYDSWVFIEEGNFQCTSQKALENIIAEVEGLVDDGVLNQGQGNSLISKLENAIKKLDQEKETPALNMLNAFKNEVNAYMQAGILTAEQGQGLIDAVDDVIAALTS